ncbi:MAG: zinc ribbon domain-containing protein [Burkholderiales bacterium]|nr:zinc ribbon domain-containing protein [Burkholderiales bacterium]
MPSDFQSCRACGEAVYVRAKRCPNCGAPTSWRTRLRSKAFPLLILTLVALVVVGVLLYGWPDETVPEATVSSELGNPPQASALPMPPPAADNRPLPPLPDLPPAAPGAANADTAQTAAGLEQRDTERAEAVTVRGKRIELGMSADRLFELVSRRDLLRQTMEPDPLYPPNLRFLKYYRVDNQEFAVELRRAKRDAPYTVTSIHIVRAGDRSSTRR